MESGDNASDTAPSSYATPLEHSPHDPYVSSIAQKNKKQDEMVPSKTQPYHYKADVSSKETKGSKVERNGSLVGSAEVEIKENQHAVKESSSTQHKATKEQKAVHDLKTQQTVTSNQDQRLEIRDEVGVQNRRNESVSVAPVQEVMKVRPKSYSLSQLQAMRNRAKAPFFNRLPGK